MYLSQPMPELKNYIHTLFVRFSVDMFGVNELLYARNKVYFIIRVIKVV